MVICVSGCDAVRSAVPYLPMELPATCAAIDGPYGATCARALEGDDADAKLAAGSFGLAARAACGPARADGVADAVHTTSRSDYEPPIRARPVARCRNSDSARLPRRNDVQPVGV